MAAWLAQFEGCAGGHNLQQRVIPNMLRKRIHRSALRLTGTGRLGRSRVRQALHRTGHRAPPDVAEIAPHQRERFNGRISDVPKTNRFDSALDLEQTLMRSVHLSNTQLPQSALGSRTPMTAMKDWHKSHPHLFANITAKSCGTGQK